MDPAALINNLSPGPDTEKVIEAFFARVKLAWLFMPDGWFDGRPMDSLHQLTFVSARPKRLLIELDGQMLLSFAGEPLVAEVMTRQIEPAEYPALVVSGFRQCVVDFLEYGTDDPHVYHYETGTVELIGQRGPPTAVTE